MRNPLGALVRAEQPSGLSIDDYLEFFQFNGDTYGFIPQYTQPGEMQESIGGNFTGLAGQAFKSAGPVYSCLSVRQMLFSEIRFQFRKRENGRAGDLFGNKNLAPLETPWPGGTTGDLCSRAIQDADLAGNFFGVRRGQFIRRARPDWMKIVLGSKSGSDIDLEPVGYIYAPQGRGYDDDDIEVLGVDEVMHFAPTPDPEARYRGMSWLTPVIREIMGDKAATAHKLKFFEQGATPNLVVKFDPTVRREDYNKWVDVIEENHKGLRDAYKTLYLGGGSDVTVVGGNLKEIDFREVQGHGETRIAAAAGVPPVIVGLSEGLRAATYSNYQQAMRRFSDGTMRPLWRNFANSAQVLVKPPQGTELWYDDRDIPFLKEDAKDEADIQHTQAQTIQALTTAGYIPETVVQAVLANDYTKLKHSGLMSVQMWKPGQDSPAQPQPENGSGNEPDAPGE